MVLACFERKMVLRRIEGTLLQALMVRTQCMGSEIAQGGDSRSLEMASPWAWVTSWRIADCGGSCMVRAWRMGSVLQQQETSLSSVFLLVATEVAASLLHQLDATERRLNGHEWVVWRQYGGLRTIPSPQKALRFPVALNKHSALLDFFAINYRRRRASCRFTLLVKVARLRDLRRPRVCRTSTHKNGPSNRSNAWKALGRNGLW